MNPETVQIPKLVNENHFTKVVNIPKPLKESIQVPKIKETAKKFITNKYFTLNFIILVLFFIFMIFFLINCKYGMFKNIYIDPVPYSLVSNNS